MALLSITASFLSLSTRVSSQAIAAAGDSSSAETDPIQAPLALTYVRPTQKTKFTNYLFDGYGLYPLAGSALTAGFGQLTNSPPEWGQGAQGYGKRIGSDFGLAAAGVTGRYGLALALKEDTLYYRCECRGWAPRLKHAVFTTFTARRGGDGHSVFSIPALVAPYAGSFTAVYGWYPDRFGAKDAFRIGNYGMLDQIGANVCLEFLYSGPHSLLSRMHLTNGHGTPRERTE